MSGAAPKEKARHRVASLEEIPEGGCKIVKITRGKSGVELGVFRLSGQFYAYRNICPHAGAPVCEGKIAGTTRPSRVYEYDYTEDIRVVRCPWHGWEFDIRTGRHLVDERMKLKAIDVAVGPAGEEPAENLEAYPVEVEGTAVYVLL